uniref:Uncharacterized protein n=1 Tax=Rhizophagus irregularis (strain DAOM 181602 / DAOM 197198 / MUCL 43194) TaxID=747089 RepID=U9U6F7_RHIID
MSGIQDTSYDDNVINIMKNKNFFYQKTKKIPIMNRQIIILVQLLAMMVLEVYSNLNCLRDYSKYYTAPHQIAASYGGSLSFIKLYLSNFLLFNPILNLHTLYI